jgi:hypothetical protein
MKKVVFLFIYLIISILVVIPLFSNAQTCIIMVIKDSTIYVGADTKWSLTKMDVNTGKQDTVFFNARKIFTTNGYTYGVVGYNGNYQHKIADSVLKLYDGKDPQTVLNAYGNAFADYLTNDLIYQKKLNALTYYKFLESHKPYMAQTIFCSFIDGKALVLLIEFTVTENRYSPNVDFAFEQGSGLAAGETKSINQYLNDKSFWKDKPLPAIKKILEIASKASPGTVGKPFDLFVITKDRVKKLTPDKYTSVINPDQKF